MHAVVRTYSGQGARALFDMVEERRAEVESMSRSVLGYRALTLLRTEDGGVTVTVCYDKTGTDECLQPALNWIAENAPDLAVDPPSVSEGAVLLHLS
jgi:hypothetical protein